MLKPELCHTFEMALDKDYTSNPWPLLVDGEKSNSSEEDYTSGSSEEDYSSDLNESKFEEMSPNTAVPKPHRQVEEHTVVNVVASVRENLLEKLQKPPQTQVMSSRLQPRKGYTRQEDMPKMFQAIHDLANVKRFHFQAKPGAVQKIKKANGYSWGTETEEIYRHSLAIMLGSEKTHKEGLIEDYYDKPLIEKQKLLREVPEDPLNSVQPRSDEEKMVWLTRIWNAHSGEVATLIPEESETPWTWSSYDSLQQEFRNQFADAKNMKEFYSLAAWLATKEPFNDTKFKFEKGPRFLMQPTAAQSRDCSAKS